MNNCIFCWSQVAAAKVSRRLHNKPRSPTQLAADVVEQVLRTGGDPYLQTMEHTLTWWQLSLIDVKLFIAMCVVLIVGMVGATLWALIRVLHYAWKRLAVALPKGQRQTKRKTS